MTLTQFLLILHILAIAYAMGLGLSNFLNMRIAKGQTGDIAKGLAMHRLGMLRFTDIALAGIIVTGLLMVWVMGGVPASPPWFHVKMAAVVVLVLAYAILRMTIGQMLKTGNMALAARIGVLTPILSVASIVAVACAVLAFRA